MELTISFRDLGLFILFSLAAAVGVYIIMTLRNLNDVVKRVGTIVKANEESIQETLTSAPKVLQNVNDITVRVKDGVDKAEATIGSVGNTLTETVSTVSENTEDIISYIKIIGEVVKGIVQAFHGWRSK